MKFWPLLLSSKPGFSPPFPATAALHQRSPRPRAALPLPTSFRFLRSAHGHVQPLFWAGEKETHKKRALSSKKNLHTFRATRWCYFAFLQKVNHSLLWGAQHSQKFDRTLTSNVSSALSPLQPLQRWSHPASRLVSSWPARSCGHSQRWKTEGALRPTENRWDWWVFLSLKYTQYLIFTLMCYANINDPFTQQRLPTLSFCSQSLKLDLQLIVQASHHQVKEITTIQKRVVTFTF